jgi:hypothetical protein
MSIFGGLFAARQRGVKTGGYPTDYLLVLPSFSSTHSFSPTAFTVTTRSQWLEHAQDFNGHFFTPTRSTGQPG